MVNPSGFWCCDRWLCQCRRILLRLVASMASTREPITTSRIRRSPVPITVKGTSIRCLLPLDLNVTLPSTPFRAVVSLWASASGGSSGSAQSSARSRANLRYVKPRSSSGDSLPDVAVWVCLEYGVEGESTAPYLVAATLHTVNDAHNEHHLTPKGFQSVDCR